MLKYLLKRVLWMIPMLIGISLISFFIMHLAPGDVTTTEASFNPKASEESRQKLRELYNLDKPVIVQYGLWMKRMATLDFGTSFASHQRPVFWQSKDKDGNVTLGMIQEAVSYTHLDVYKRQVCCCANTSSKRHKSSFLTGFLSAVRQLRAFQPIIHSEMPFCTYTESVNTLA